MSSAVPPGLTRARRALLFVPGDDPRKIAKAAASGADCVVLDLEDGVAAGRKLVARETVASSLQSLTLEPARSWCGSAPSDGLHPEVSKRLCRQSRWLRRPQGGISGAGARVAGHLPGAAGSAGHIRAPESGQAATILLDHWRRCCSEPRTWLVTWGPPARGRAEMARLRGRSGDRRHIR
jgi:hypothetical protein